MRDLQTIFYLIRTFSHLSTISFPSTNNTLKKICHCSTHATSHQRTRTRIQICSQTCSDSFRQNCQHTDDQIPQTLLPKRSRRILLTRFHSQQLHLLLLLSLTQPRKQQVCLLHQKHRQVVYETHTDPCEKHRHCRLRVTQSLFFPQRRFLHVYSVTLHKHNTLLNIL